jgi:putative SOS response-associated peptidase YedK
MPVLLSKEDEFETWLSGSPAEAFALARSFDPAQMRIVQSGKDKEDLLGQYTEQTPTLFG